MHLNGACRAGGHQGALEQQQRKTDAVTLPGDLRTILLSTVFVLHVHTLVMGNTRRKAGDAARKLTANGPQLEGSSLV